MAPVPTTVPVPAPTAMPVPAPTALPVPAPTAVPVPVPTAPACFGADLADQYLSQSGSGLSGTIPTECGLLTDLKEFSVGNNELTGAIPTEVKTRADAGRS